MHAEQGAYRGPRTKRKRTKGHLSVDRQGTLAAETPDERYARNLPIATGDQLGAIPLFAIPTCIPTVNLYKKAHMRNIAHGIHVSTLAQTISVRLLSPI